MKIRVSSLVQFLGLVCIITLPNHDLINFLFAGTPLVVWKQGLTGFLAALTIVFVHRYGALPELRTSKHVVMLTFLASIPALFFAVTASDISAMSLAYGCFFYLGGVGGILYGANLKRLKYYDRILNVVIRVGILSSFFVIIDYFTNIFSFLPRESLTMEEVVWSEHLHRAAGLFGASTLVAPFLLFSIAAGMIRFMRTKRIFDAITAGTLIVLCLGAIFLSGSRAGMLTSIALVILLLSLTLWYVRFSHTWLLLLVVGGVGYLVSSLNIASGFVRQLGYLAQRYMFAFASDAAGNEMRYSVWQECLDKLSEMSVYSVFGTGFGSSSGTFGEALVPHCESSLFQSLLEAGPIGFAIRYGPGLLAIGVTLRRAFSRGGRYEFFEKMILVIWILGYFALISTSPTAGALHNQFIYMMVSGILLSSQATGLQNQNDLKNSVRAIYAKQI